jgi:uncharacterized protein YaeQ
MAEKSTIYRATIELSDIDRGVYAELPLTVACHPSETPQRLVARLLAYALNYQEGLSFSKGICEGDSPDIWVHDLNNHIEHWIEVGLPTPERILDACRRSRQVTFYLYGRQLSRWQQMHLEKLQDLTNLQLMGIPDTVLDGMVASVQRTMHWSLTITEGTLYLTTDQQSIDSALDPILAP